MLALKLYSIEAIVFMPDIDHWQLAKNSCMQLGIHCSLILDGIHTIDYCSRMYKWPQGQKHVVCMALPTS